jgi:rhodanese-related sulfurtransferase
MLDLSGREQLIHEPVGKLREADISCQAASDLIARHRGDPDFIVLDVRTEEKFEKAHLENAVRRDVYAGGFDEWLAGLDKNKTYLVYCTIGKRSGIAVDKMKAAGFENVHHMYRGLRVCKEKGYMTVSGGT